MRLFNLFEDDSGEMSRMARAKSMGFDTSKELYHGSKGVIDSFDTGKALNGWVGKGFYFTDLKKATKGFGSNVSTVYLKMLKPYVTDSTSPSDFSNEMKEKFGIEHGDSADKALQSAGYDGVIYKHWDDDFGTFYVVYEPNQVRLVTADFDPSLSNSGNLSS